MDQQVNPPRSRRNWTAAFEWPESLWRMMMPKSLYARALIIIIAPIIILQSVLAFVFMERHWNTVTLRLSDAVTGDIAAVISLMEAFPGDENNEEILQIARDKLNLRVAILPPDSLPPPAPKPFFTLLDRTLSEGIRQKVAKPFWIDTVGRSNLVEIRIRLEDKVVQIFARRSQTYASNSHIFLIWMGGTALVLLVIAIIFMRNQIRPIQRLANAAEDFGKGRDHPDFKPAGALEVRRASRAFIEMRERIERQIEQRTTMLAGVSHDLRTILTRFKLQLAVLGSEPGARELEDDVNDMQKMLEGYLDFARGNSDEQSEPIIMTDLLEDIKSHAIRQGKQVTVSFKGEEWVKVRPMAFKRCLSNLVANAVKFGSVIKIIGDHNNGWLSVTIEDDGPGIPVEERENVFRPFYRIDSARNINANQSGTGLGLAIALDITRAHGGEIILSDSDLGGLAATVRIPA